MRFFLLDVSRGVSVLAMICYHFYWDLGYFGFIDLTTVMQGVGLLAAQIIGVSFITIAGISGRVLTFSKNFKAKFSTRIVRLIILSAIISIATFFMDKNNFIFFWNITLSYGMFHHQPDFSKCKEKLPLISFFYSSKYYKCKLNYF